MTKFIRTGIADKNIHPPYFEKTLYEADVDENEDLHHTVLTVSATDHDEGMSAQFYLHSFFFQSNFFFGLFGSIKIRV